MTPFLYHLSGLIPVMILLRYLIIILRIFLATIVSSLSNMEGDEVYEVSSLGYCEEVQQERVSDDELIIIRGPKARSSASIIVRGANYFMCDEIERSTHDALCVVKRVFESKSLLVGGGSVEAALSIFLENYADR